MLLFLQVFQLQSIPDRLGWIIDTSYTLFVSFARRYMDGIMFVSGCPETRWNNWIPIKINILIWMIRLLSIPTSERLSHRDIIVDLITCLICLNSVETINYIFAGCTELIALWSYISIRWGLQILLQLFVESLISWSCSISS